MTRVPLWQAVAARMDVHPPLYYGAINLWARLVGMNLYALRFLSLAFGLPLVALAYGLGRTVGGPSTGVLAAWLVALSPLEVYYTQELRMYPSVAFFGLASMLCLARLLSIPARYRVGYIYTGANYANKVQSEASHAWAELYLPWVGWRGFDPTNGCVVGSDHVRVAAGRHFRDASPMSGRLRVVSSFAKAMAS